MEHTQLYEWLRQAGGYEGGELPAELIPALQTLRDNMNRCERKTRELLRQKQLFTLLVNGTVDMFVMFSAKDFRVEYVSPNTEYLLGLSLNDVRKQIHSMTDEDLYLAPPPLETLMQIPLGGSVDSLSEMVHRRTGARRWYRKTIYHFYLNNDHKFIMVLSDRTEEIEVQQQLEISIDLAKSANEAKSSFLANMSHDLRTPMNAIVGFSRLLGHDAENPAKVREYGRKITASSQHLLNLINDILDMSKIESGKATLHYDEFELSELLEGIRVVLSSQSKAKNQSFSVRTYGITNDRLVGDKTRINQILMNLLSNAVKYTPEGGEVQLIISQMGTAEGRFANFHFQVADNGMGMSPEYLEVIFEPFTREETGAVRGIQGTGLGMAITKNLVELMGGSISVTSELGKGSCFTVEMKLQAVEQDGDREFWKENHIQKILVVDDDEAIGLDIKKVMKSTGVIVAHCADPLRAIDFVVNSAAVGQPYDLVLMDRKMPVVDGLEATERIQKTMGEQMPSIIMMAYDWSDIEERAAAAGVKAFLTKPFLIGNFHDVVRRMVDPRAEESGEDELSLEGLHFLAAEDNELNAEILKEILDLEGAACDIAENGEEAVKMLLASKPGQYDVILMDVQMPVLDGYGATRAIRASEHPDAKTIPITAMTANAFDEDVRRALDAGMNAHISKPVDMAMMKATILELLHNRKTFAQS